MSEIGPDLTQRFDTFSIEQMADRLADPSLRAASHKKARNYCISLALATTPHNGKSKGLARFRQTVNEACDFDDFNGFRESLGTIPEGSLITMRAQPPKYDTAKVPQPVYYNEEEDEL